MTSAPLFGLLILERDPYTFGNFLGLLQAWLQDANRGLGGIAATVTRPARAKCLPLPDSM